MPLVDEQKNVYTSVYSDNEDGKGLQKIGIEIIKGQAGKYLRLDSVSLRLGIVDAGVTATATVMLVKGGLEIPIAVFSENSSTYQYKSKVINHVAGEGEDLVTRWYLKSSIFGKKVKMRIPTINYSVLNTPPSIPEDPEDPEDPQNPEDPPEDPEEPEEPLPDEDEEIYLMIPCKSETEAEAVKHILSSLADSEVYVKRGGA